MYVRVSNPGGGYLRSMGCFFFFIFGIAVPLIIAMWTVPFFAPDIAAPVIGSVLCADGELDYDADFGIVSEWECRDDNGRRNLMSDMMGWQMGATFGLVLIPVILLLISIFSSVGKAMNSALQPTPPGEGLAGSNMYMGGTSYTSSTPYSGVTPSTPYTSTSPSSFSTPSSSNAGLADKLKQLDDARAQGLLTDAEYERKRQEILRGF
jgi:hypothetical protein